MARSVIFTLILFCLVCGGCGGVQPIFRYRSETIVSGPSVLPIAPLAKVAHGIDNIIETSLLNSFGRPHDSCYRGQAHKTVVVQTNRDGFTQQSSWEDGRSVTELAWGYGLLPACGN